MNKFIRTDNTSKRIITVQFNREYDDDPDLSNLGEYRDKPGDEDKTIDRKERGDCGHHEYRYFVATMSEKETGSPGSVEQDYQRMEAYNRGEWTMSFCLAKATVSINGVMQSITSGGSAALSPTRKSLTLTR